MTDDVKYELEYSLHCLNMIKEYSEMIKFTIEQRPHLLEYAQVNVTAKVQEFLEKFEISFNALEKIIKEENE